MINKQHQQIRAGITLVEVAVSTVLTGLLMAAALQTVAMSAKLNTQGQSYFQAQQLAHEVLSEAMSQSYQDQSIYFTFGREGGESYALRSVYDDFDDYNGYSTSTIRDREYNVLPEYAGYQISVTVIRVSSNSPAVNAGTETGLKKMVVTVTDPSGATAQAIGFRAKGGLYEQLHVTSDSATAAINYEWTLSNGTFGEGTVELPNRVLP